MLARLIAGKNEEGGSLTILINGEQICAMDCLCYGHSPHPYPKLGEEFTAEFTCMFDDDESSHSIMHGNQEQLLTLQSQGGWSYRAFGKILSIDTAYAQAKVDCGVCVLAAPIEILDPDQIGHFIAFSVQRLDIWRA